MSPGRLKSAQAALGFPRVSGDEPRWWPGGPAGRVFSPRERG